MDPHTTNPGERLGPLRRVGASLLALARSRFELFTVELQEEKLRLLNLLFWMGLASAIGAAGVFVAIVTFAFWLWTAAGYAGVAGLAVVAMIISVLLFQAIRRQILAGPMPFSQTVDEFKKDSECLRPHS